MQHLPQFVQQARHYASSLGKEVFAESETFSLGDMYQDIGKRPTLAALAKEVCAYCYCYC